MPPVPSTGQSMRSRAQTISPCGCSGLYLAIATIDLLHSVCHQNRPFLLTLQFLQLGVALQPNVITTVWNRDTEDVREACSETKSRLTSLSATPPSSTYLVSVIH